MAARKKILKKAQPPPRAVVSRPAAGVPPWIHGLSLALLASIVYLPALNAGFIWDDEALTTNPHVTSFSGLWKIWLLPSQMPQEQHYWPLVYTTFWLEHLVAGLRPFLYHLDNILLHGLVTILLWRVLVRLSVPGAWLGAALFAVHPVHAESVAWIIERKDVLSGAFYMGAALAYLRFHESDTPAQWKYYVLALGLFAAALLSKSIAVTLPVALVSALFWRNGRIASRDLISILPFVLLALVLSLADMHYYRGRQLSGFANSGLPLPDRILMAGGAIWVYLSKLAWPWPLATFYHKWQVNPAQPLDWAPLLAWVALLAGLWFARKRIGRGPFLAMMFFSVTLAPILGFVDFDFLSYSWIADRFQYLAAAGPLILASAGFTVLARRFQLNPRIARFGPTTLLTGFGLLCFYQASLYHDSASLFRAGIARQPHCRTNYTYLAYELSQAGRGDEAIEVLRQGLRNMPHPDYQLTLDLAHYLAQQQQYPEAEQYYKETLSIKPDFVEGLIHYGAFLVDRQRYDEAVTQYKAALHFSPDNSMALCNLGNVLRQQNKLEEAEQNLERAVHLNPEIPGYHVNFAQVLSDRKKFSQAIEQCQKALEIDPHHLDGHFTLGQLLSIEGQFQESISHLEQVVRLSPEIPAAYFLLGQAYQGLGNKPMAARCYQETLRLQPDYPNAASRLQSLGVKMK